MKRIKTIVFLGAALFALGAFAAQSQSPSQQPSQSAPPAAGPGEHRQMPTIDEQVKTLTDRLTLTEDQQAKTKTILEDQHTQAQAIMKDDGLAPDEKRQKFMGVRQGTISKIRELLNDDQKKKFEALLQEMQGPPKPKSGDGSSPK
jgi:hypothetical protein